MKRFFCLFLVLSLVLSASVAFCEYPLSENEKNYVGAWCMYANSKSGKTYVLTIAFLDSMEVVQSSLIFKDGSLSANNKASGEWSGFTDNTILFSLAGQDMTGMIKDDGYLYLYFFDDLSLCGIYSKCEDMTSVVGW